MAFNDNKILPSAEHYRNVSAQAGTRLTGTVAENKAVFDDYPELIAEKFNAVIDELTDQGVDELADDINDRYTKQETEDKVDEMVADNIINVTFNSANGTFTFTRYDGDTFSIDTNIEKIPATLTLETVGGVTYLVITNMDGTVTRADVTSLLNLYVVSADATSDTISVQQSTNGTTTTFTLKVKAHSIGAEELEVDYLEDVEENALKAEGYAVGKQNGSDVTSGPYYQNNAKYYNTQAQASALSAESSKNAAAGSASSASGSASSASSSASSASGSATTASQKAILSESWAVGGTGTRQGEDINNAKFWAEQAAQAAGGGVTSFNGRSGVVTPQSGDYNAGQISETESRKFVSMIEKEYWNFKANDYDIPTELAELDEDSTHRTVTDTEKSAWNAKQNALGFTPENSANKATSISGAGDNTHYPTTKAVVDALSGVSVDPASANTLGTVKYAQGTATSSAFTSGGSYEDYPYRATVTVSGCTANHFAEVAFSVSDAVSGKLAPVCETYAGGIYIYSTEAMAGVSVSYKVTYNA